MKRYIPAILFMLCLVAGCNHKPVGGSDTVESDSIVNTVVVDDRGYKVGVGDEAPLGVEYVERRCPR